MIEFLILIITSSYHFLATLRENKKHKPPGELIDIGGYKLHLYSRGEGEVTVIVDHSLGGIDGYFLIDKIAKLTKVCIYDRPGYGWSEPSKNKRCSQEIALELDLLLEQAKIDPPYILLGQSFGSYNVRLYARYFPEKVAGIILTDGLHEEKMLKMPPLLNGLKVFFMSGFVMSAIGSILGIVRILGNLKTFELLKRELRKYPSATLFRVKRSFYSHNHWITMWREMWHLDLSAKQVREAKDFGDLPVINIKAKTFLKSNPWNFYMPLKAVDRLRDRMHEELLKLSSNCRQIQANKSDHFVWIDQPEVIIEAIEQMLALESEQK
ncbi:MAG: alpha/beta hydrolase [Prochloraceae cyanobacterium]|nr:alpha/beta hydrolase [Prochloraceae cyanobacterium]